ncbi:MAG: transposase [bacterium]
MDRPHTKKQLLARSRYLLFKPKSKWTNNQLQRSIILFKEFPQLQEAYHLSMMFRAFYECSKTKEQAKLMLERWYTKVEEKEFDSFLTTMEYLKNHESTILNYFTNRSTNASVESFNAKLKGFRSIVRGVRDKKFFLFRVSRIYG